MPRSAAMSDPSWREFHAFWFPPGMERDDYDTHRGRFLRWFRGGTTEGMRRFAPLLARARRCELDGWTSTAEGRLALVVLLDQAPRSLFAGTAEAFACDQFALRHAEAALASGDYAALRWPWEKTFILVATSHAEGPDHLARLDRAVALGEEIARACAEAWRPLYDHSARQAAAHREVIARFGRFPHRNAVLGRPSSPEEAAYVATGDFVHLRTPPSAAG
ncbi:DUF924 family protein [Falsiroseomonas sp. HW251]|uniref:DUF924 family protein n=1 Tax=Falsiroseomonas sp. HW251 TaxID=3390998 RepID=UPI003D324028